MVHHVVKYVHVFSPVGSVLHTPPPPEGTLVGKPHWRVAVAGVTDVDSVLGQGRSDLVSIVNLVLISVLLLVDVRAFHGEGGSDVVE